MGLGIRYFIFPEEGQAFQMPQKRFMRIASAEEPYPQAACQYLRFAEIVIDFQDRAPVAIIRMSFSKLHFDDKGFNHIDEEFKLAPDLLAGLQLQETELEKSNVVEFIPRWAEKEKKKRKWIPKPQEIQVIRNYFPDLI